MPLPVAPRRAVPPRKKPAKSPSPAPQAQVLDAQVVETPESTLDVAEAKESEEKAKEGDREKEVGEIPKEAVGDVDIQQDVGPPTKVLEGEEQLALVEELAQETKEPSEPVDERDDHPTSPPSAITQMQAYHEKEGIQSVDFAKNEKEVEATTGINSPSSESFIPMAEETVHHQPSEPIVEPEIEEDDAVRRKRVAERLAKMGAINPLSAPPVPPPQSTISAEPEQLGADDESVPIQPSISPPPPQKRASLRKDSTDSTFPVPPERRGSLRKVNIGDESAPRRPVSPPPVPQKRASLRKGSTDSSAAPSERRESLRKGSADSSISFSPPPNTSYVTTSPPTSPKPDIPIRKGSVRSIGSGSNSGSTSAVLGSKGEVEEQDGTVYTGEEETVDGKY